VSVLSDIWRQLVRRKLLPVAGLLLAAIVAAPVLLAKDPKPAEATAATPAVPVPAAGAATLTSAPIVTVASAADRAKDRKVLGRSHDIFASTAKVKKAKKAKKAGKDDAPTNGTDETTATATGGGASATSDAATPAATGSTGSAPAGGASAAKPAAPPAWSIRVRLGAADASEVAKASTVERLAALPSDDTPGLVYLGLLEDRKTAVFLLADGVTVDGDGRCRPTPDACTTVLLKKGATEFVTLPAAADGTAGIQYQLDLVAVHPGSGHDGIVGEDGSTAGEDDASATRSTKALDAGRKLLASAASASAGLSGRVGAGWGDGR
jgi:hypothetical protein